MTKVVCYCEREGHAIVADSVDQAYENYKTIVDEWISPSELTFIEIPDDLPRVHYQLKLVPVTELAGT